MKQILFLFFISTQITAQTISFNAKLLDRETQKPIVYANVSFLKANIGISSTEKGTFNLEIDEKFLKEKVHISCLNYKDTIVLASELYKKIFFLEPKRVLLDEVVIFKKIDKTVVLDEVKKKVFGIHTVGMRMLAKFFPNNPKKQKGCNYISKIALHFSKRHNKQSKFRIRVFNKDLITGLPKDDLLNVNLPVTITEGQLEVDVDVSDYDIEMPKEGIFIAFEKLFIPFNEYGRNRNESESEVFYSPVIGFTKYKYRKEKDRLYYYVKGSWKQSAMTKIKEFKKYAPAISLTVSN
jgi:hypothetical protein